MVQIIEMTDKEKMAMYMKLSKKELAQMLLSCNRLLGYSIANPSVSIQPWEHKFDGDSLTIRS